MLITLVIALFFCQEGAFVTKIMVTPIPSHLEGHSRFHGSKDKKANCTTHGPILELIPGISLLVEELDLMQWLK